MIPFRFVHASDLHLGSLPAGVDELNPRVARRLRDATFQSFDRLVDLCIESQADFLVVAGGVLDSQEGSLRAQLHFCNGLRRLAGTGIQAFVCHGDEDPLDSWSTKIIWPQETHIFGGLCVERVEAVRGGQALAEVYGVSHPTRGFRENLVRTFPRRVQKDVFAIGIVHGTLESDVGPGSCAPFAFEDLASVGMDYWALGHLHACKVVSDYAPAALYPGSPQGMGPGEAGKHGCYLVHVHPDGSVKPEFVASDVVRWSCQSVSIEDLEGDGQVFEALQGACEKARQQADGRDAVCRMVIDGPGEVHKSLRRPGFASDLVRRLRDEFGEGEPFVWVGSLEVNTRPPVDIEARRAAQDFLGDLLRLSESYRNDPARLTSLRQELATLYSSSQGRRLLTYPTDEDLLGWLATAEVQCLDLLAGEEEG